MLERRKCFIIQPLADEYKRQCDETYKSAIEKAGLVLYRVDEHYNAKYYVLGQPPYVTIKWGSKCPA